MKWSFSGSLLYHTFAICCLYYSMLVWLMKTQGVLRLVHFKLLFSDNYAGTIVRNVFIIIIK